MNGAYVNSSWSTMTTATPSRMIGLPNGLYVNSERRSERHANR